MFKKSLIFFSTIILYTFLFINLFNYSFKNNSINVKAEEIIKNKNLNFSQTEKIKDLPWKSLFEINNDHFRKLILPSYIDWNSEVFQNPEITNKCNDALKEAWNDVQNQKTWAVKLFDSWAKFPPSGAWLGTLTDFGGYDQCLSIKKPIKYCLIDSKIPMPQIPQWHNLYQSSNVFHNLSVTFDLSTDSVYYALANVSSIFYYVYVQTGICLPEECSAETDIFSISQIYASKLGLRVTKFSCENNDKIFFLNSLNYTQIIAFGFLLIVLSLNIFSFCFPNSSKITKYFHPITNVKKIFLTDSKEDLNCIHGIRFFTMLWIIAGHTLEWNNLNVFQNTFEIREQLSDLSFQPFFKAHYSVDTFFYLSGLLTSYVTLKYSGSDLKRFKILPYLFVRYFRLTPQLGVFLLLSSILPLLFDGPLWTRYMEFFVERCKNNWWINIIYLQNVVDLQNICMVHTWYLAVDMQLHWFSLLPIIVIFLNRKKGLLFTKSIILVFTLFCAVWIFLNQLPPGSVITSRNNFLDENGRPSTYLYFFYKPWNHASVFFIGFIFGFFIDGYKNSKNILPPYKRYFAWFTTLTIYLFCCLNTSPWLYGRPYDPAWSALLYPLNLIMWSVQLTLIIWLCMSNNGGYINRILSSSHLRPFSRMTYCVYLVHPWAFSVIIGSRRSLISRSLLFITSLWLTVIVLSYLIALIFTILFEVPVFYFLEYFKDKNFSKIDKKNYIIEMKENKEFQTLCNIEK